MTRAQASGNVRALSDWLTIEYLRWTQEGKLFSRARKEPLILSPGEYAERFPDYAALADFKEEILDRQGAKLGLWVRAPDDATKPVYVLFHGRHGHWGYAGFPDDGTHNGYNRQYRLGLLHALAKTGAGVIAVHPRGHGLSRGMNTEVGEAVSEEDAARIADYLQERGITGARRIVAGESKGGADAAILEAQLQERGDPSSVLGLIATFAAFEEASFDALVARGYIENTARNREHVKKVHRHPMDTAARLREFSPGGQTKIYVASVAGDEAVAARQHGELLRAAREAGFSPFSRVFSRREIVPGQTPHSGWPPEQVAANLQAVHAGTWKERGLSAGGGMAA